MSAKGAQNKKKKRNYIADYTEDITQKIKMKSPSKRSDVLCCPTKLVICIIFFIPLNSEFWIYLVQHRTFIFIVHPKCVSLNVGK